MSIKGLTDRGLSFPQIGNVRKGGKKEKRTDKNGREYEIQGKDLTYFRVEFDEKEPVSAALFLDKYGNQPTEINFVFPFNEIDRCWEAWLEAYTAGRMVARSDGEYFTYWLGDKGEVKVLGGVDESGAKVPHVDIVGKDYKGNPVKLRPVGRLRIVIPELQRLAYLVVHTTSKHDIINISEQLEGIRTINGGRLVGIPLVLRRRPRMISTPDPNDAGKRVRREKWLLSVEADPEWVKAKLLEVKRAALPGNGLALLTGENHPAPVEDWEDDFDEDEEGDYPGDSLTGEIIETDAGQFTEPDDYEDSDFDPSELDNPFDEETDAVEVPPAKPVKDLTKPASWPAVWLSQIVKLNYAKNDFEAAGMLSKSSVIRPEFPYKPAVIGGWAKHYRAQRDTDASIEAAAKFADSKLEEFGKASN